MNFSDEQLLRYSRQLNLTAIEFDGQQALAESSVLILGAGGLGCPVSTTLVTAGVGSVHIMDGDDIELSNLHRQHLFTSDDIGKNKALVAVERLRKMNNEVDVSFVDQFFEFNDSIQNKEFLSKFDLVIDCTDQLKTTVQLQNAIGNMGLDTHIISAFGSAQEGQVFQFLENRVQYEQLFPNYENTPELNCQTNGVWTPLLSTVSSITCSWAMELIIRPEGQTKSKFAAVSFNKGDIEINRYLLEK